ncbi:MULTISPECIES: 3-keto-5-aminohexanoate cleavage protein [unclassified Chelatococcus]|uniref:3-keto-5-aminohexanoate cleavage protein n=1 Tax=unclassified Chelatococcus TaxID=2638111 RepID=UPI0002DFFC79|nr:MULTISPECIES: 3-keto-5-aminohexanoate cleavage protein [unclassified Chelatococcus]ALA17666.1 class III aminotransferase [Chelatococcus sp. CO-6]
MTAPFAVMVAPNGARRGKADHPALPLTAAELAREAARCREAGAAAIHLHVRDGEGRHVLDADLYRAATRAVRAEVGEAMAVQITTEAVGRYAPAAQMALVDDLVPESVSIALREIIPDAAAEAAAAAFFARLATRPVLTQIIVYSAEELARLDDVMTRGIIPDAPRPNVLAVLGSYAGREAAPGDLDAFLAAGLARHPFMVCAFGRREAACAAAAVVHGGHMRIGFENNLILPDGRVAPHNGETVAAAVAAAAGSARPLASADDLRRLWHTPLPPVPAGAMSGASSRVPG